MITLSDVKFYYNPENYLFDTDEQQNNINNLTRRVEAFGVDLLTEGKGDIQFSKRDIRTVSGIHNLAQQLLHRLMCVKGEHPIDPYLGIRWFNYFGSDRNFTEVSKATLLADEISEEISKDDRVDRVVEVSVTELGSSLSVYIEVVPISSGSDNFAISATVGE